MKNKNHILKQKFEDLKVKLSEKKFDEVINECEEILKNNDNPVFFNLLCLAYMNKKQFEKAKHMNTINLNSKNPDFYNNLGMQSIQKCLNIKRLMKHTKKD